VARALPLAATALVLPRHIDAAAAAAPAGTPAVVALTPALGLPGAPATCEPALAACALLLLPRAVADAAAADAPLGLGGTPEHARQARAVALANALAPLPVARVLADVLAPHVPPAARPWLRTQAHRYCRATVPRPPPNPKGAREARLTAPAMLALAWHTIETAGAQLLAALDAAGARAGAGWDGSGSGRGARSSRSSSSSSGSSGSSSISGTRSGSGSSSSHGSIGTRGSRSSSSSRCSPRGSAVRVPAYPATPVPAHPATPAPAPAPAPVPAPAPAPVPVPAPAPAAPDKRRRPPTEAPPAEAPPAQRRRAAGEYSERAQLVLARGRTNCFAQADAVLFSWAHLGHRAGIRALTVALAAGDCPLVIRVRCAVPHGADADAGHAFCLVHCGRRYRVAHAALDSHAMRLRSPPLAAAAVAPLLRGLCRRAPAAVAAVEALLGRHLIDAADGGARAMTVDIAFTGAATRADFCAADRALLAVS